MAISDHVRLVLYHFKIKIDVVNIALRLWLNTEGIS